MPVLVAGIHAVRSGVLTKGISQTCIIPPNDGVDGRRKAGHDGEFVRLHPTFAAAASRKSLAYRRAGLRQETSVFMPLT